MGSMKSSAFVVQKILHSLFSMQKVQMFILSLCLTYFQKMQRIVGEWTLRRNFNLRRISNLVSEQLSPRKIVPQIMFPQIIAPWTIAPQIIAPGTIAPEENCPEDNYSSSPRNCPRGILTARIIASWMIAPGLLLPDNYPKDNFP